MTEGRRHLERSLGAADIALLTVGSVVGSGIFFVPGTVVQATGGSIGLALMVWVTGGVLSAAGAMTLAELGSARPEAGGIYVFIRDAFGRAPAFLFGWSMLLAGISGTLATQAVAFAAIVQEFVPLTFLASKGAALAAIAIITSLNLGTARTTSLIQGVSTLLKIGILFGVSVLMAGAAGFRTSALCCGDTATHVTALSTTTALIAVLWAYEGWQSVSFAAGEVHNPGRNFPRGLLLGVGGVITLYLAVNVAIAIALGPDRMAGSSQPFTDSLVATGFPAFASAIRVFVAFAILASGHATLFTGSRVIYALAQDRLFFPWFAQLSRQSHVPVRAAIACGAMASALALLNAFDALLSLTVVTTSLFLGLAAASIFVFRRREAPAPFRVPFYPVLPLLFIGASAAIVLASWISGPPLARFGLLVLVVGWLVFRMSALGRAPAMAADCKVE